MKKQITQTEHNIPNQDIGTSIKDGVKKSSSIKKDRQLKSTIFVAVSAAVLVVVCVLYFVLSLGQGNNTPPKDRYMDINANSGSYKIKIAEVVKDAQIITEFSTFDNRQYVEVIGENSDIFCFADGKIASIEQKQDHGYIITIEHIPGMYSIYTFIEPNETLEVGQELACGDSLGIMYQSEPIVLRFEISLDGKYIDPTPYVTK